LDSVSDIVPRSSAFAQQVKNSMSRLSRSRDDGKSRIATLDDGRREFDEKSLTEVQNRTITARRIFQIR